MDFGRKKGGTKPVDFSVFGRQATLITCLRALELSMLRTKCFLPTKKFDLAVSTTLRAEKYTSIKNV